MPEFFADSALYYTEGDATQLADRIANLLRQPDKRAHLASAARAQAGTFTWQQTVDDTVTQLHLALESPRPVGHVGSPVHAAGWRR